MWLKFTSIGTTKGVLIQNNLRKSGFFSMIFIWLLYFHHHEQQLPNEGHNAVKVTLCIKLHSNR